MAELEGRCGKSCNVLFTVHEDVMYKNYKVDIMQLQGVDPLLRGPLELS